MWFSGLHWKSTVNSIFFQSIPTKLKWCPQSALHHQRIVVEFKNKLSAIGLQSHMIRIQECHSTIWDLTGHAEPLRSVWCNFIENDYTKLLLHNFFTLWIIWRIAMISRILSSMQVVSHISTRRMCVSNIRLFSKMHLKLKLTIVCLFMLHFGRLSHSTFSHRISPLYIYAKYRNDRGTGIDGVKRFIDISLFQFMVRVRRISLIATALVPSCQIKQWPYCFIPLTILSKNVDFFIE